MPHLLQSKIMTMTVKEIAIIVGAVTLFCTLIAQCSMTIKVYECVFDGGALEASSDQSKTIHGLAIFNLIMILLLVSIQVVLRV